MCESYACPQLNMCRLVAFPRVMSAPLQLMGSMRLSLKPILLTRCGECEFETQGKIGGDSRLTPVGQLYAEALSRGVIQV